LLASLVGLASMPWACSTEVGHEPQATSRAAETSYEPCDERFNFPTSYLDPRNAWCDGPSIIRDGNSACSCGPRSNRRCVYGPDGFGGGRAWCRFTPYNIPLGCYPDDGDSRVLENRVADSNDMTVENCLELCSNDHYVYAGVQWGSECWCGND